MYQFKKINEDEYILISKDKQFPFKRTVDMAKEMQSVDMLATLKVAETLAERGETYENTKLRIERKEGNKTIIDESNLRALEKKANAIVLNDVLNSIYRKLFNKSILELLKELEIDENEEEVKEFSSTLTKILLYGLEEDTPRNENTQGDRKDTEEN